MDNIKYEARVGQKFGKLTIISIESVKNKSGSRKRCYCYCDCECGTKNTRKRLDALTTGKMFGCCMYCSKSFRQSLPLGNKNASFKGIGTIPRTVYSDIKYQAKKRGLYFDITIEYIYKLYEDQNRKCALSGTYIEFGKVRSSQTTASLDRIDSSKGYVEGNVQWLHKDVNIMKMSLDQNYFIEMCNLICKWNKNASKN